MNTREEKIINGFSIILFAIYAVICVIPLLTIISSSFTAESAIKENGFGIIPSIFSVEAYRIIFSNPLSIMRAYGTTTVVTLCGTFLGVMISGQFAYALTREKFIFKRIFSFMIYFTMLFSGGLVPTYILITRYLNLKNSLLAIILPMAVSGWNIFLLRTYFHSMPESLVEAAKMEGASEFHIYYKLVMPLNTAGLTTVALTVALGYWNDWYNNMLYITDTRLYSLQYLLQALLGRIEFFNLARNSGQFVSGELPKQSLRMATCVLAAGPMLFVFCILQKYFARGVTVGAVKG